MYVCLAVCKSLNLDDAVVLWQADIESSRTVEAGSGRRKLRDLGELRACGCRVAFLHHTGLQERTLSTGKEWGLINQVSVNEKNIFFVSRFKEADVTLQIY